MSCVIAAHSKDYALTSDVCQSFLRSFLKKQRNFYLSLGCIHNNRPYGIKRISKIILREQILEKPARYTSIVLSWAFLVFGYLINAINNNGNLAIGIGNIGAHKEGYHKITGRQNPLKISYQFI